MYYEQLLGAVPKICMPVTIVEIKKAFLLTKQMIQQSIKCVLINEKKKEK